MPNLHNYQCKKETMNANEFHTCTGGCHPFLTALEFCVSHIWNLKVMDQMKKCPCCMLVHIMLSDIVDSGRGSPSDSIRWIYFHQPGQIISVAQHVFHLSRSVTLFKNREAYSNIKVDINLIKCLDMDLNLHFINYMFHHAFAWAKRSGMKR